MLQSLEESRDSAVTANSSGKMVDWLSLSDVLVLPNEPFINGSFKSAHSHDVMDCVNPYSGERLNQVAACDEVDIDAAVQAARKAFEARCWSTAAASFRKSVLRRFAAMVRANAAELALMDALAMGKPITDAYEGDVPSAAETLEWFAESSDRLYGETLRLDAQSFATVTRQPLGVVGLITPWNYPIEEAAIKLGPALAAGNSVVLKPAEISPFSAIRLGQIAIEAGLPAGVLNVVPGRGSVAGKALALHDDVDCIGFTGSTETGKSLLIAAGQSNMKRIWLECGGKSPNIVFDDCDDLRHAAAESVRSVLRNQGQVCSAGSRLFVQQEIATQFLELLVDEARKYVPGDPLDPETKMGPLASADHYEKVLSYIEIGLLEHASLVLDGRTAKSTDGTTLMGPTIFTNVRNDMRIAQEEIFGPVISVIIFEDEQEVTRLANESPYGLVASLWTSDLSRACRVSDALEAGSVTVNGVDAQSTALPFGGFKQSGIGREHSNHAFDQYTNTKTTWINYQR